MLKLYSNHNAPSPRRARILLAEKGIEYEKIQVEIAQNEHLGEAYKQISPRGLIPALVTEDGTILNENVAIATYLEGTQPEPPMLGHNATERALILEWNVRCEVEGFGAVAEFFRNRHPAFEGRGLTGTLDTKQIPDLVDRGRARTAHFFEELNTQLKQNDYVAGAVFSFADITALMVVDFAGWEIIGLGADRSLGALWDWHARVAARPSYTA